LAPELGPPAGLALLRRQGGRDFSMPEPRRTSLPERRPVVMPERR
jgi:hypothetical protein